MTHIDRYEIRGELARGGMATLYTAYDPRFEREVAVKLLSPDLRHDPAFRTRFAREARTIAALEHPAIVAVYDAGETDGQPYLVMRLMRGGSLADRLRDGPLPLPEAARILQRIAPALDEAHRRGVIHRDLKPDNILFDEFGAAYLADFGIVKQLATADIALTGQRIVGTPAYMSPEQAAGDRPVDGRSDIYALAVILFEMLGGRPPYDGDTPLQVALKHITEPIPRVHDLAPGLPPAIGAVLARGLAKAPEDRYSTAAALARTVAAIARGQGAVVPPGAAPHTRLLPGANAPAPAVAAHDSTGGGRTRWLILLGIFSLLGLALLNLGESDPPPPLTPTLTPAATPTPRFVEPTTISPAVIFIDPGPRPTPVVALVGALPHEAPVLDLVWSPRGDRLAAARQDGRIDVHNVASGQVLFTLSAGLTAVQTLDWSPDGALLAGGGADGQIRLWDADGRQLGQIDAHDGPVTALAWAPDGDRLLSAGRDGRARVWRADGSAGVTFDARGGALLAAAWAPDGRRAIVAGAAAVITLFDPADAAPLATIDGHLGAVSALAWSPDGRRLASGGADGALFLWTADGAPLAQVAADARFVSQLDWAPDSRGLVVAGGDGGVVIWDGARAEEVRRLADAGDGVLAARWSPAGDRLAAATRDGQVVVWNVSVAP